LLLSHSRGWGPSCVTRPFCSQVKALLGQ
jgi:hypothetical protein